MASTDPANAKADVGVCVECLKPPEECACPQGFTDPEALAQHLAQFVYDEASADD